VGSVGEHRHRLYLQRPTPAGAVLTNGDLDHQSEEVHTELVRRSRP
jgi:hypothetical protein